MTDPPTPESTLPPPTSPTPASAPPPTPATPPAAASLPSSPPSPPAKTRAELLAERQAEPEATPKAKTCFWCGHGKPIRLRRGNHIGIIVERRGTLDVHAIRTSTVKARSGRYVAEGVGFLVEHTIPRGARLTIWPEGDPEPFTGRDPKGYGAGFLERLLGGSISNALKGSFASSGLPLTRGARILLLIGGLCVLAALAFLWMQRHGGA